jgi:hypothetical protein
MSVSCPHCGYASIAPSEAQCPICAHALSALPARASPADPLRAYFRTVRAILTRPAQFFRAMPAEGGVSGPLAFALVTHWLGEALEFLWRAALAGRFNRPLEQLYRMAGDVIDVDSPGKSAALIELKDRAVHWFWGAGRVIVDPFYTLVAVLFTAFFVYLGARLLVTPGENGAPSRITFESALRIVCFGMTPAILAAVPLAGTVISSLAVAIVTIIAAREVYRIGNGRATVVALFPKLLFLGILMAGLGLVVLLLARFVLSTI